MHHLFLSLIILLFLFFVMGQYLKVEESYTLLCWIPIVLATALWSWERSLGSFTLAHATWHLTFDASYLLTLAGISLILRAFVRKRPLLSLICATCVASLPIIALTQLH